MPRRQVGSRRGDIVFSIRTSVRPSTLEFPDHVIESKAHHTRPVLARLVDEPPFRRRGPRGSACRQSQSGDRARATGGGFVDIPNCSSSSLARAASVTNSTALSRPPQGHFRTSKS
jgi:hypothetical protein